jgi:hypothetical protein
LSHQHCSLSGPGFRPSGCPRQTAIGDFKTPDGLRFGLPNFTWKLVKPLVVATTSNQKDANALGPERKHDMESLGASESSRGGNVLDCDDKWQG